MFVSFTISRCYRVIDIVTIINQLSVRRGSVKQFYKTNFNLVERDKIILLDNV